MVKRQAAESMMRQKEAMIAALYSNPNWDQAEADRPKQLKDIEEHYGKAIELVYHPERAPQEVEIDWDNPFWQAVKRGQERTLEFKKSQKTATMQEVTAMDEEQLRARERSRREMDQASYVE